MEHAPQTPCGVAVLQAVERPGIWRRAGMTGAIVGLDLQEARVTALALGAPDTSDLVEYLVALEIGALEGQAKNQPHDA